MKNYYNLFFSTLEWYLILPLGFYDKSWNRLDFFNEWLNIGWGKLIKIIHFRSFIQFFFLAKYCLLLMAERTSQWTFCWSGLGWNTEINISYFALGGALVSNLTILSLTCRLFVFLRIDPNFGTRYIHDIRTRWICVAANNWLDHFSIFSIFFLIAKFEFASKGLQHQQILIDVYDLKQCSSIYPIFTGMILLTRKAWVSSSICMLKALQKTQKFVTPK